MAPSSQVLDPRVSAPPAVKDLSLIILLAIGALVVLRLWFLPLANSYWLDETFIVTLIRDSFGNAVRNAFATHQSAPFTALVWLVRHIGDNEVVLRLPSLLAGIWGLFIYYRIGSEFIDREAGLLFAGVYASLGQVAQEVPNVHPYALALAFEAAGILWLLRWSRSGRIRHGILCVLCTAAAVYFHIVFVIAVPIVLAVVLWCALRQNYVSVRHVLIWVAVTIVLLLPALVEALAVARDSTMLSWAAKPTLLPLLISLCPAYALAGALLMLALSYAEGSRAVWEKSPTSSPVALLGSLLISPVLLFFLLGTFTAVNPFAERYLLPTAPGLVLLGGWLLSGIKSSFTRRTGLALGLLIAGVLLGQPSPRFSVIPNYHGEDWREAAKVARNADVVIVYPGAVETRHTAWLRDPVKWRYLIAPVLTYDPELRFDNAFVLPLDFGQEETGYVRQTLDSAVPRSPGVAIVTRNLFSGQLWDGWMASHLQTLGFTRTRRYEHGRVTVTLFVLPNSQSAKDVGTLAGDNE